MPLTANVPTAPPALSRHTHTHTHTTRSFDWFVPVEIEPGKYVFRVAPVGHLGPDNVNQRFSEKEQVLTFRVKGPCSLLAGLICLSLV